MLIGRKIGTAFENKEEIWNIVIDGSCDPQVEYDKRLFDNILS